ncbi:MAG: hypothetical protein K9K79_00270, partial [Desulfohalobiaceae bacterium]|nr:hypothetical protein [Desulfohalobiaceae bacterium]
MNSILIIRLSAIGDIVMASGVIPVLRRAYPRAVIDWLVQTEGASMLSAQPELREVLTWPRQKWSGLFKSGRWADLTRQGLSLARLLRSRKYDLVLDLQGLFKSGILASLAGGAKTVGLDSREGSRVFMDRVVESVQEDRQIASEYRMLMQELALDPEPFSLGITPAETDRTAAAAMIKDDLNGSGLAV